jgi:hypothetical protein
MKGRIGLLFICSVLFFALATGYAFAGQAITTDWEFVLETNATGPVSGSLDDLGNAIKNGASVKVVLLYPEGSGNVANTHFVKNIGAWFNSDGTTNYVWGFDSAIFLPASNACKDSLNYVKYEYGAYQTTSYAKTRFVGPCAYTNSDVNYSNTIKWYVSK